MSPWSPPRPCGEPRCPAFAEPGRSRCRAHQQAAWREQNQSRPRWVRRFYDDPRWRSLRAEHLALHPQCEQCEAAGRAVAAAQVDHVTPMREDPSRALDPTNLRSLCKSCHSSKTLTDRHRGPAR